MDLKFVVLCKQKLRQLQKRSSKYSQGQSFVLLATGS